MVERNKFTGGAYRLGAEGRDHGSEQPVLCIDRLPRDAHVCLARSVMADDKVQAAHDSVSVTGRVS